MFRKGNTLFCVTSAKLLIVGHIMCIWRRARIVSEVNPKS